MWNAVDKIYAKERDFFENFVFDERVANVFPDMITRSVPGYSAIIASMELLAAQYAQCDSQLYDLGCSLGATALAMQRGIGNKTCKVIGIDRSEAMIRRCKDKKRALNGSIEFKQADISEVVIQNASIVALNFTLQFIELEKRASVLKNVEKGLRSGGVLVLSEKLVLEPKERTVLEMLHTEFKRRNGYSDLEISQKREAIANVLIPETFGVHQHRLHAVGFKHVVVWFQHFNFISLLAFK